MKRRLKLADRIIYSTAIIIIIIAVLIAWNKGAFKPLSGTAQGLQKQAGQGVFYVQDTLKSIQFVSSARHGIVQLSQKNMVLDMENQSLRLEADRLRRLQHLRELESPGKRVRTYASVIGANNDGFINFYTLDRGTQDGVEESDGVYADGGVIGRVVSVSDVTCKVQLLTDLKSSISARDERSAVSGILTGDGNGGCELSYVPKEDDVVKGDTIYSSELGNSFPAGIKIGEVSYVEKKGEGLSLKIKVKPYVGLTSVREVLIIRKK
jgi:rod shape-determining protein MreC